MLSLDPSFLIIVGAAFLFAGIVKGVIGMGLPTVSVAILTLTVGLKEGIALIIIPTVLTNIWQAAVGGNFVELSRRFWTFILAGSLGTWYAAGVLARSDALILASILGVIIILYAGLSLSPIETPAPGKHEVWLSPVTGAMSGVLMGLTGAFFVPGVLFLQSLRLDRDRLVQVMGIAFAVVTIVLGVALARYKLLSAEIGLTSTIAIVPAVIGMTIGQYIRRTLSEERFRKVFFIALILVGIYLALRPLIFG